MDHMKLTDELRQQLMEAAVWKNDEIAARLDESGGEEEVVEVEDEEVEEEEVVEEGAHVCPLCVSQLDESIDEERILEHLNVVLGLVDRLSQLNEGDEDIESVIDETIADILFADEEE
jgi:DNA repair exonuclease SbcCD ATPase subunit